MTVRASLFVCVLLAAIPLTAQSQGHLFAVTCGDGGKAYAPAITKYTAQGMDVPTPSVKTGFAGDIYLSLDNGAKPSTGTAKLKIFIKPLIVWLWIGGMLCAIGTVLAAFPGRFRRKPTDPVSALVPLDEQVVAAEASNG